MMRSQPPIPNTYSSSASIRKRRCRGRSQTPPPPSRLGASNSTPPTSRPSAVRFNGRGSEEDEATPSFGEEDGSANDDTTPTFVWETNISVQDVKSAIEMFVKHFRENKETSSDDLFGEGMYMASICKENCKSDYNWVPSKSYTSELSESRTTHHGVSLFFPREHLPQQHTKECLQQGDLVHYMECVLRNCLLWLSLLQALCNS
ncbi:unnamed protein product [Eruca vesicaria subsp. sativa]|uniref:Uncharacterized protein n=1 Tax=Eruca vesicaria subsp. sativa TaxID=29727 RepID=A0ABC8K9Q1_ERUVS|nr:unnamed protein product [Eruca vesicaria subsp. sativa]